MFGKELGQGDTEQAGKGTTSFPMVVCADNKPLAGFHDKRQAIGPGTHSLRVSKGTFLHLLWLPHILPTALISQRLFSLPVSEQVLEKGAEDHPSLVL